MNIAIKLTVALLLTAGIFSCYGQQKLNNETKEEQFDFNQVYNIVFRGDLSGVLELLDSTPDSKLTIDQKKLRDKYYKRFRYQNEDNDWIAPLLELFQSYWREALQDYSAIENADVKFKTKLTDFFYERNFIDSDIPRDTVFERLDNFQNSLVKKEGNYLYQFIKSKGFYGMPLGRMANYYDLLLWAKQTEKIYDIKLTDQDVKVKVIFMEDFISNGWIDYATFGEKMAGGWAEKDALYCVKKLYDTSSEQFLVSYLRHEAQHFADYISFPKLTSADLEYRAKLAEMSKAKETVYKLLNKFINMAHNDRNNGHPFASYCLIRDLSKEIFNQEFVSDIDKWKNISYQEINIASIKLLKQNTEDLKNAGAETVTEFIK